MTLPSPSHLSDAQKLEAQQLPASLQPFTRLVHVKNSGVDNKMEVVVSVVDALGDSYRVRVSNELKKGDSAEVQFVQSGLQIKVVKASFMVRGSDGIGRFVGQIEANSGRYFTTLSCWIITDPADRTVEDALSSGSELRI